MTLSADQRAMLELLLERGQTYADLAGLLGGNEADVRGRARQALTELGGRDPDRHVALTDYLLGQADPIDRADAVRHLKDDPEDLELVRELQQKLRLIAPGASLPRLPGEAAEPRPRRVGRPAAPAPEGSAAHRARVMAAIGSGALILLVGILAIAGVFSGDSDDEGGDSPTTAAGGCTASVCGHPLVPLLTDGGDYRNRAQISPFQVPLAQQAQAIAVGLSDTRGLEGDLEQAVQAGTPIINYDGKTVLEGRIPRNPDAESLQRVTLSGRGDATGTVVFAQATGGQPFIEFDFKALPDVPRGQAYVLWLLFPPATT